jgi:hypothetical protein
MKPFISTWIAPKWLLACSSIFLVLFSKQVRACGPDFTGYYCTYLLNHYTEQEKFYAYQLDPNYTFYNSNNDYYDREAETLQDANSYTKYNLAEWKKYLGIANHSADEALQSVIYGKVVQQGETPFVNAKDASSLLSAIVLKNKKQEINNYFLLLNEYKKTVATSNDAWNYNTYTNSAPIADIDNFVYKCKIQMNKTEDQFLKWRYLYMILRAYHFNKHHAQAIDAWQQIAPNLSQDNQLCQYWCEGIYSGALLRNRQMDKSIYYAARQFVNCPDQHKEAMQTYLWSGKNWKSALPFCKNSADTLAVIMLDGLHHPEPDLEHMQSIATIDPNADVLKILWLRETSKIEQYWLNSDGKFVDNYYFEEEKSKAIQRTFASTYYLEDYLQLSKKILETTKNESVKTTIGNTLAYYFYRKKDWASCNFYLQQIENTKKVGIENQQYLLMKNLLALQQSGNWNVEQVANVLFNNKQENGTSPHLQHYLIHQEIAPYYLSNKDSLSAFWMYAYDNSYSYSGNPEFSLYNGNYSPEGWNNSGFATYLINHCFGPSTIMQLRKQYNSKKGNTETASKVLQKIQLIGGDSLFNMILAQKCMLAENWVAAQKLLPACPKEFTQKLGSNPANLQVNDFTSNLEGLAENTSVAAIVNLMNTLQQKAKAAGNASDKLLYATALYSLSFYGKNHYILDNHWHHNNSSYTAYYASDSVQTSFYNNGIDKDYMPMNAAYKNYFYLTTAEKFAKQALPLLSNAEDRAKCTWLLAKCWQKRCPLQFKKTEYGYWDMTADYEENSFKNPYFSNFSQLYATSAFYEEAFSNCSYLQIWSKR